MSNSTIPAGVVMTFVPTHSTAPTGEPSVTLPVHTVGIDLGDRYTHFCVLDTDGKVVQRDRFRTRQEDVKAFAKWLPPSRVVMEVGTQSPWISRAFEACGHEVIVANPRRVKLISEATRKNDRRDAELLARLGRADPSLLSPIQHRGAAAQGLLAVVRARSALVRSRAALVTSVRNVVKSAGFRIGSCSTECFHKRARAEAPPELVSALQEVLASIEMLTKQIKIQDKKIEFPPEPYRSLVARLRQINGVGPILGLTFVLTIDDPSRFARGRDVGAYLGLTPRQSQSGGVDPRLGITKTGDCYLRQLLVGSAHRIIHKGPDTELQRFGRRLMHRDGSGRSPKARKQAAVGVARKLAILLLRLWVAEEDYLPLRADSAIKTAL
jgi:transposase